jgi:hypothetical protein
MRHEMPPLGGALRLKYCNLVANYREEDDLSKGLAEQGLVDLGAEMAEGRLSGFEKFCSVSDVTGTNFGAKKG